jgi:hypothetical protein
MKDNSFGFNNRSSSVLNPYTYEVLQELGTKRSGLQGFEPRVLDGVGWLLGSVDFFKFFFKQIWAGRFYDIV